MPKGKFEVAKAFAPAAISSFFEICDSIDGKPIANLDMVGARGGGFGLQKGTTAKVIATQAPETAIDVFINGENAPKAMTSIRMVQKLLKHAPGNYKVTIDHRIEIPVGAGFGTSAGGAKRA